MTDDQINHMVNRFLAWRLPENFCPDAGISFKPTFNEHMPFGPMKHEPTGTNLFDATQAEGMIRHLTEGLPANARAGRPLERIPVHHCMAVEAGVACYHVQIANDGTTWWLDGRNGWKQMASLPQPVEGDG